MNQTTRHQKLAELAGDMPEIRAIRHRIHSHPEIAFEERSTAALVAEKLAEWGFEVATGVGTTGVVGTLSAGTGGRRIGLRADMDALSMQEKTGLPYASRIEGKMHACGHDGHTAMLLGAARYLARTRNFSGTLHLYFQPAEERGHDSGAERMIADGLFERFPCDAVFGMHNHPGAELGHFMMRKGAFQPATDKIAIRVIGKGGHVARPHLTVDPSVVSASIVMALQSIVSRNVDPMQTAVLSVCSLQSGGFYGVIPDEARIELSVRCFDPGVRVQLRERIEAIAQGQAQSYGASVQIEHQQGYPVLVNTGREVDFAVEVARELVGPQRVDPDFGPITPGEDFAFMLERRPGCYLRLGNGLFSEHCHPVHHPRYDFNDDNLLTGAAYWSLLVERYLVD
ncbi:amidohydrolase [Delftia sp. K82]|uniref:M20 aminoacylase family protein n=1 Tax=Delftia sp. K82 TaxID=1472718 RepID=UPI000B48A43E|nr:M20 aminoacylase family protein [Delftia sp. K82]OWG15266.1 amidohydrolase [Delftia sp. K82]